MNRLQRSFLAAAALAALLAAGVAPAAELVVGEARAADAAPLAFRITGKSPEDVLGGAIHLGDARYVIQRVSRRGLIGGARVSEAAAGGFAEYAVFSSSFSDQTAVGQPWVAASAYHHCDRPYNSFLAVYRVDGADAAKRMGPAPYPDLVEDVSRSDRATVYCFMSGRGSGE